MDKNVCLNTFVGHSGFVTCLIETKGGNIVSGSCDNTIKIWDLKGTCLNTFKEHSSSVCCMIETKDKKLLTGSEDTSIKFWV